MGLDSSPLLDGIARRRVVDHRFLTPALDSKLAGGIGNLFAIFQQYGSRLAAGGLAQIPIWWQSSRNDFSLRGRKSINWLAQIRNA